MFFCKVCPGEAQRGAEGSKKCVFQRCGGTRGERWFKGLPHPRREAWGRAQGRDKLRTLPSDEAFSLAAELGASSALQHFRM